MNIAEFTNLVLVPVLIILIGVVTFLTAKALPAVNEYLRTKVGAAIYDGLKARVLTFVSALAQDPAWSSYEGSEKKQRAILWLVDYAEDIGVPLPEALAEKLVEEAYLAIKDKIVPVILATAAQ